jgi:RNA polymerase sigma factor (sigma-70 family)
VRQTDRMDYKGDTYYIGQVLEGNQYAFGFLVDKHKDHVYNLALRICGNNEEAEEIAQDAFVKAYRSLAQFKMKSSFATWLYRIVYNTSISLVRARKKKPLSLEDFPADATDFIGVSTNETEVEEEYKSSLVNFALQKISEEERGLIGLYYYEELKTEEISEITGISKSNIKIKLFRARQKMIEIIKKAEKKNLAYYE